MNHFSPDQPRRAPILILTGLLLLLILAGCQSTRDQMSDRAHERQYFKPTNFNGETRLPVGLRRVLLLPVCGGTIVPPETATDLEEIFATELQKQLRFEVVRFTRTDCLRKFGQPEFSSVAALPHDFLAILGRDYAADAVLFLDVTSYHGYRPLALGVRAKLATVEQTRLLWTFDEIFSADDPAVSNSVRRFFGASDATGIPLNPAYGALQSPGKFATYVAAATFATLPPR
jgi:hypothetical protein